MQSKNDRFDDHSSQQCLMSLVLAIGSIACQSVSQRCTSCPCTLLILSRCCSLNVSLILASAHLPNKSETREPSIRHCMLEIPAWNGPYKPQVRILLVLSREQANTFYRDYIPLPLLRASNLSFALGLPLEICRAAVLWTHPRRPQIPAPGLTDMTLTHKILSWPCARSCVERILQKQRQHWLTQKGILHPNHKLVGG